jgi:hypothetical protein
MANTEGDAFFGCFANPRDAITAVRDAQCELTSASWPAGLDAVKVRMGVHTGYVEHRELGYVGLEIHRAARVGAAANGGQVPLTGVTEALLRDDDIALEYVGEHRLKDFPRSEALFHLVIDGRGAGEFPALRTAISRPTNLREDLRPLVGRDGDLDELCALVRRARLVSVVGAGGAGIGGRSRRRGSVPLLLCRGYTTGADRTRLSVPASHLSDIADAARVTTAMMARREANRRRAAAGSLPDNH